MHKANVNADEVASVREMVKHLSSSLAAARSRSMRAFTAVSLEETWSTERESVRIGGDGSGGDDGMNAGTPGHHFDRSAYGSAQGAVCGT